MRTLTAYTSLPVLLILFAAPSFAGSKAPAKEEHPGQVALLHDSATWSYVHFPSNVRLYVFDGDPPGKSACNEGCSGAWPPLVAPADAKPLGDWSVVARSDGRKQWAYKSKPVYLLYHDSVDEPRGDGAEGKWHFLEP